MVPADRRPNLKCLFMIKNKIDKRNKTPQGTHTLINVKFKDNSTIYNYIICIIISKSVQ